MGCSIQYPHDNESRRHENEEFNKFFNDEITQQLDEKICNISINDSVLVQQMLFERQRNYCSNTNFGLADIQENRYDSKISNERKVLDSILKQRSKERKQDDRSIKRVTFAKGCLKNKKKPDVYKLKTISIRSRKKQITIKDLDLEFN